MSVRLSFAHYQALFKAQNALPLWVQTEEGHIGRPTVDRYLDQMTVSTDLITSTPTGTLRTWYRYKVLDSVTVLVRDPPNLRQECFIRASLQVIPILPGFTLKDIGRVIIVTPAVDSDTVGVCGPSTQIIIEREPAKVPVQSERALPASLDKARRILQEAIILPLLHADELRQLGIDQACRGLLLSGPAGGGKTHLVRSLATDWSVPLLYVAAGQGIISSEVGQAEERLKETFSQAKEMAQQSRMGASILFIDEIDVIGVKRGSAAASARLLGQLLSLMDHLDDSGVMVVGATNRPDALDGALRRAGRFDREIIIEPPTSEERAQLLNNMLERIPHTADISTIAHQARGYVAADLAALVREALRLKREAKASHLTQQLMEAAMLNIPPSLSRHPHRFHPDPHAQWSRIVGYQAAKDQVQTIIQASLNHRLTWLGARPPRGILLHGPAGCGKTMMAHAIANQGGFTVYGLRGDALYSAYQGESERLLRHLFLQARQTAPSLILIDELESMVGTRSTSDGDVVRLRILSTLLNEMDGFSQPNAPILVIGCARQRELIDDALLRPGRFDQHVQLGLPSSQDRLAILQSLLQPLPANVDYDALVEHSAGWSVAHLQRMVQEASLQAMQSHSDTINQSHFNTK